ncbi:sulfurtransferase [Pseudooceanicola sp.]|uniref:sulfurtransferase n=1 Tax=Pseudooceanicola sp. TaxID=1914328 RepID=UPI00260CFA4B|nr:sulfurtransferase [Pseudooceanicola sp.]MDF1855732.1 sulfurtransferase [Pseudooceanicola sp.]
MLCTSQWLQDNRDDPRLRIFDCSVEMQPQPVGKSVLISGRPDWQKAHIPGARYLSMGDDLSAPEGSVPYGLPPAATVQRLMRAEGVNEDSIIVLYGRGYPVPVMRCWWVLLASGARDVRLLDGGLEAWVEAGLPLTDQDEGAPEPGDFVARPRPDLRVDAGAVAAAMQDPATVLVNALSAEQFAGTGGAHYGRPGRIPGSVSVPFRDLLEPGTTRLRPAEALHTIFDAAGVLNSPRIINYCGGGIAASGTSFALHLIGRRDAALYDGSLIDWASDPARPMESEGS